MKFKFLDHPADLRIQADGKTIEDIFTNMASGMMSFLYPKNFGIKEHETKKKINIHSKNKKTLLIDWLSELLILSDTKDVCYNDYVIDILTETQIKATIYGRRVHAKEDIKAVTHHDLEFTNTDYGYRAIVVFDI